ncbi:DUF4214 domain-containing protein [Pontibacterium sp. N1Y112]|uniref:DUF4214 domain-containing protein n=1 Tax=Pontibacterium sinense TaxID=2781979 RepID=A0A8J7FHX4_9GAMM|nr:DUF4214 domain-containing protein [Pontibacterium sinense]MBE9399664.1 DUF4214 domain-containing protein [Pontibacterium sinense]
MTRTEIENSVQELYVGILGRSADATGLKYWADEIEAGTMVLENTRAAFTQQDEYTSIYGGLSSAELVTKVYQNMLARDPDSEGLAYWSSELDGDGPVTPDMLVLAVLNAAKEGNGADNSIVINKTAAATDFTNRSSDKVADKEFLSAAKQVVDSISQDTDSVTEAQTLTTSLLSGLNDRFILKINYENHTLGAYSVDQLKQDAGPNADSTNIFGAAEVVSIGDNQKLKVTLEAGSVKNGIQWYSRFDDQQELYFYYEITYAEGMQWTAGIKGPGLGAKVGDNNPTGLNDIGIDGGFSLRTMTREDGKAVQYIYDQRKEDGKAGEDVDLKTTNGDPVVFQPGEVIQISQRVKMNTPNVADGELVTTINGEEVLNLTDRIWSQSGEDGINSLFFDIWHGGSNIDKFIPSIDSHVYIDNIGISTQPITPDLFN